MAERHSETAFRSCNLREDVSVWMTVFLVSRLVCFFSSEVGWLFCAKSSLVHFPSMADLFGRAAYSSSIPEHSARRRGVSTSVALDLMYCHTAMRLKFCGRTFSKRYT